MPDKILYFTGISKCIGCYSCMFACARYNYRSFSPRDSAVQIKTIGGYEGNIVADYCRGCLDPPCAASCPTSALTPRPGGGVKYSSTPCDSCGNCLEACPVKVITVSKKTGKPIICVQCGICTQFCPHGCLEMRRRELV